jgi:hypothetical protein
MTGQRTGRRGNGEGSIYQLADGRGRGSVFLGYRNGKPHRKYLTRRTRTEAAEIRSVLEAQRQGQLVTTGTMTVGEWLGTYLEQVAGRRSAREPTTGTARTSSGTLFRQSAVTASTSSGPVTSWPSTTPRQPRACQAAASGISTR